jgi:hypothetical protein
MMICGEICGTPIAFCISREIYYSKIGSNPDLYPSKFAISGSESKKNGIAMEEMSELRDAT